jgi:hypothetical protein
MRVGIGPCCLGMALAALPLAGQTISNVRITDISHSSVSISWSTGYNERGTWNAGTSYNTGDMVLGGLWVAVAPSTGVGPGSNTAYWQALSYRVATGTTTGLETGPGGQIYAYTPSNTYGVDNQVSGFSFNLYGLAPSTTYYYCVETSLNGAAWPDGPTACPTPSSFTTAALPAVHPAYPASPKIFSTAYPDTTGYTVVTIATDCSDLQTRLNTAAAAQPATGTVIQIPVGTFCTGSYTLPADPTVKTLATSATVGSTGVITLTGHGLTDGEKIRTAGDPPGHLALLPGVDYYVHVIDANTFQIAATLGGPAISLASGNISSVSTTNSTLTVQYDNFGVKNGEVMQFASTGSLPSPLVANTTYYVVNANRTDQRSFQVSTTSGGSPITLTNAGSGAITMYYPGTSWSFMPWTGTSKKIIIRSAAPDSKLPPAGVEINPEWAGSMAGFKLNQPMGGTLGNYPPLSLAAAALAHDYTIGPGIEWTTANTMSDMNTVADPGGFQGWLQIYPTNSDIIFDRNYFTTPDFYVSIGRAFIAFDGNDVGFVNNYVEHWNNWTGGYRNPSSGTVGWHVTSPDSTHLSWAPGSLTTGPMTCTNPGTVNATLSGTGTGAWLIGLSLDCKTLEFFLPTGSTVTSVTGWTNWTQTQSAAPAWPQTSLYGNARDSMFRLSWGSLSSGSLTTVNDQSQGEGRYGYPADASNRVISGLGPGPFEIENNYMEGTGITWHFDDSNSFGQPTGNGNLFCGSYHPSNITFERNYITSDKRTILDGPWSDGNRYFHRNHIECKNCSIFKADGNIIEYDFDDVTAGGGPLTFMATRCGAGSDFNISDNTIRHAQDGLIANGGIASNSPVPPTTRRLWLHNNLVYDISSVYSNPSSFRAAAPSLLAVWMQNGGEDVRIEHNTFDAVGIHFNFGFWEGVNITDNYWSVNNRMITTEGYNNGWSDCPTLNDQGAIECVVRQGCGSGGNCSGADSSNIVHDYLWRGDAFNIWNGIINTLPQAVDTGAHPPQFVDSAIGDYTRKPSSPLFSGAHHSYDNTGIGADIPALNQAQGFTDRQRSVVLSDIHALDPTASGATIVAKVPDPGAACSVGYGTSTDPPTWNRTSPDTANSRARSIVLTGLTSGKVYNYQLWCAGTVPTLTQQFETR